MAGEQLRGDNVLWRFFRTGVQLRQLMNEAVEGTGIRQDEYGVLSAIGVVPSISPTELSSRLGIPPTTISRYVASFVSDGLVERAENPSDGRSYVLALTPHGRSVVRTIAPRIRAIVERLSEETDLAPIEAALAELERVARGVVDSTAVR